MTNSFMEIQDGKAVVHIEGAAVIDTAANIHKIFSEAIESHKIIVLDIENVSECDCSFIQLMRSLCFSLNKSKRVIEIYQHKIPGILNEIIKTTGYQFKCECTRISGKKCLFTENVKPSEKNLEVVK